MFDPLVGFLIIYFYLLYLANLAGRNPLLVGLKSPAIIKDVLGLSEVSMSGSCKNSRKSVLRLQMSLMVANKPQQLLFEKHI